MPADRDPTDPKAISVNLKTPVALSAPIEAPAPVKNLELSEHLTTWLLTQTDLFTLQMITDTLKF